MSDCVRRGGAVRACPHMRLRRGHLQQLTGEAAPPQGVASRAASVLHGGPRVADSGTQLALSAYCFPADVVA